MNAERSSYVHPETGELLATEAEWRAAIATLEEQLSRIYGPLWKLRDGYAERFPPAELPSRRYRSEKQEQVARCPRCGSRARESAIEDQMRAFVEILERSRDPWHEIEERLRNVVPELLEGG